jgi:UDP-GlcNAc:undecaprenyl-phosphate GlcNAc-1-phosphate transferase
MRMMILAMLATVTVTLLVIQGILHGVLLRGVVDRPNERSLHANIIPRTGGVGVMAGVVVGCALLWGEWMLPWVAGGLALAFLSFVDDMYQLPAGPRFFCHFLVAGGFLFLLPPMGYPVWALCLVAVAMVWMTNLYNFMDGSDGLAGGMAVFGFGGYAIAACVAGDQAMAEACGVVVAAALVFLRFNFHPARIFMGDVGSIPLGFFSAALGLFGEIRHDWSWWFPVIVFSPFIVDATVTLLKRLLRGEKVWQAHRSHYYQRLVQMGWGHRTTALAEYGAMAAMVMGALLALHQSPAMQYGLGLGAVITYGILAFYIDRRWTAWQKQS